MRSKLARTETHYRRFVSHVCLCFIPPVLGLHYTHCWITIATLYQYVGLQRAQEQTTSVCRLSSDTNTDTNHTVDDFHQSQTTETVMPESLCPGFLLSTCTGHFMLNFHYYELPLSNYLLLIYCSLFTYVTSEEVREAECGPWSAEYLDSAEKLRIFRRR